MSGASDKKVAPRDLPFLLPRVPAVVVGTTKNRLATLSRLLFVCQHAYVRVALRGASVVSVVASATTVSIDMGSIGGEMSAGWKWLLAVVPSVVPLCTVRAATVN